MAGDANVTECTQAKAENAFYVALAAVEFFFILVLSTKVCIYLLTYCLICSFCWGCKIGIRNDV